MDVARGHGGLQQDKGLGPWLAQCWLIPPKGLSVTPNGMQVNANNSYYMIQHIGFTE
jgi:hypothetical protein